MPLSDIVNVVITRQTQSVSEAGFGTLMILGANKNWNDLIRKYSNMQDVAVDFNPTDPEFIAAQDVFAQAITPPFIYIGRRTVDTVTIDIETPLPGYTFTTTINGTPVTIPSTTAVQQSVVSLSGIVTNVLDFSGDFGNDNIIVAVVNGVTLAPVNWVTSQAATLTLVASGIGGQPGVTSSTVTGARQITVVFAASVNSTVNSVTSAGTTPPTMVNTIDGPLVDTNQIDVSVNGTPVAGTPFTLADPPSTSSVMMATIASAIAGATGIVSASLSGVNSNIITVVSEPNLPGVVTLFDVSLGSSQATAIIVNTTQPTTVFTLADAMVAAINAALLGVTASDNLDGTFNVTADVAGVPYTIAVSTNIINPNKAQVLITQAIPNQAYTVRINGTQFIYQAPNNLVDVEQVDAELVSIINTLNPDKSVIDFDINFVALNSIVAVVNGVALSPVTFTTDQPTTMQLLANQISTAIGVFSAVVTGARQITVTFTDGDNVVDSVVTTLGVSQPSATIISGVKLQPVSAFDNFNGSFEVVSDVPTSTFNIQVTPPEVMVVRKGMIIEPLLPSASVVADLNAIQAVNDDWYGLACTDRSSATVQSIAAWIEPQIKIFGTASSDPNIINEAPGVDTTSVAAKFNNLGYVRTFVLYHQDADADYPECAWFGAVLPLTPGSETWKFKFLASINYSDLSTNQENNAFGKEANTYEFVGGVGITQNGTMAQGEFIDIIRGVDWLTATIQSYVYSVLVNNPKVPYTNQGIAAIESQIRRALALGVDNNFIASEPPFTVTVPNALTVPAIDKANRILNNVKFQATLAGAIHAVVIRGTVSV